MGNSISYEGDSICRLANVEHGDDASLIEATRALMTPESGVSGVRIENFVSPDEIDILVNAEREIAKQWMESASLTNELRTLGIGMQNAYGNTQRYFQEAEAWRNDEAFMRAIGPKTPVLWRTIQMFETAYGIPLQAAAEQGRELLPATLRCVDFAHLHKDVVASQVRWEISRLCDDIAWNIYLRMPKHGGELELYPPEAANAVKEREIERFQPMRIRTRPGDLVFFRSNIPHAVTRVSEPAVRLTVSGCVGFEKSEEKLGRYWA